MEVQRSLTWPSKNECERITRIICESNLNPFRIAAYNPNDPVSDFVGRQEELSKLKEQLNVVFQNRISRAVRLDGPAGVGKSTLFNYLKESIELERASPNPSTHYILRDTDIFSTYFYSPERISKFSDIWNLMMDNLKPGFEKETGQDLSLPDYIAYLFVFKMFQEDPNELGKIIWDQVDPSIRLDHVELRDIIDPLARKGRQGVEAVQKYYIANKWKIRNLFKRNINGINYELKKADNSTIQNLFRVFDEEDPDDYLNLILKGSDKLFRSNEDLINYFNHLMRFYACLTNKQPLLLIGIDDIAKTGTGFSEDFYLKLGNLFVRLRDTLDYTLFVFISTTTDWANFDRVINLNTDLKNQIKEFMYPLVLKQLEIGDLQQVFIKRMNKFWSNHSSDQPSSEPNYPFSRNFFEYAYRFNLRDLRDTIHFLSDFWVNFRLKRKIPKLELKFDCMREVYKSLNRAIDPDNLREFEWLYIRDEFNKPSRFNSNSSRSSAIEKGLASAFRCLINDQSSTITSVKRNPIIKIKTDDTKRKPDVLVILQENLGSEFRRAIEFQVKAYGQNSKVNLEHIESSIELFEKNYTDFIYFIITGSGLDSNAENLVKKLEKEFTNRIRRPVLSKSQENKLFLLALYEEITGEPLGRKDTDVNIAKKIISDIIGQDINSFLLEIKNYPFRGGEPPESMEGGEEGEGVVSGGEGVVTGGEGGVAGGAEESRKKVQWIIDHPEFGTFKYEMCGLCLFLQTREKNPKTKFTFYIPTVLKNVISPDVSYNKQNFEELINFLKKNNYIEPVKSSFKLTKAGEIIYAKIKLEKFEC